MLDQTLIYTLLVMAILGFFFHWLYQRKHIRLTDAELLEFLSLHRWKSGRRIRKEIESRYRGGWFGYAEIYLRLIELEEDGRIERRSRIVKLYGDMVEQYEYRKKYDTTGGRKEDENIFLPHITLNEPGLSL